MVLDYMKYKMRVVRGAFKDQKALDELESSVIKDLGDDPWKGIEVVEVGMDQIKDLQKNMTHHFEDATVPWYMDGYAVEDKNKRVVAFGADDGEGGRIFEFPIDDQKAVDKVVRYGIGKGIPEEQMDFAEIDF